MNRAVQNQLNKNLKYQEREPINFETQQQTLESIQQRPDITFDIILECIQQLQNSGLDELERDQTKNYHKQKMSAMDKDFDPVSGINTMVWEENHDHTKDL